MGVVVQRRQERSIFHEPEVTSNIGGMEKLSQKKNGGEEQ